MKQAPKIKFNKSKPKGLTYVLPQKTMDEIFSKIDGKNGNALKLIVVLLGTKEGFRPSTKWLCDRTGMKKTAYYRARDYLTELGILDVYGDTIKINI